MRTSPVIVKGVGTALALSVVLVLLGAGEARGAPGWSWPVEGSVLTPYSNDEADPYAGGVHRGIDIAAAVGSPVRAARAGEVTYAGALGYSGLTVAVRTGDGYVTSYLHLSAIAVHRGETVAGGSRLGEVGTSGRRSKPEPHLHFGVRIAAEEHHYVDPLSLLPPLPGSSAGPPPVPKPAPVSVRANPAPVPVRSVPMLKRPARAGQPAPRVAGGSIHLPLPPATRRSRPVVHPPATPTSAPALRPRAHGAPIAAAGKRLGRDVSARGPQTAAAPSTPAPSRDWGRPLAVAGLGLMLLVLFGGTAYRTARDGAAVLAARALTAAGATNRVSTHIRPLLRGQPRLRRAARFLLRPARAKSSALRRGGLAALTSCRLLLSRRAALLRARAGP